MDRPLPHDPLLDGPPEPPEPRREEDPDDARDRRLEDEWLDRVFERADDEED